MADQYKRNDLTVMAMKWTTHSDKSAVDAFLSEYCPDYTASFRHGWQLSIRRPDSVRPSLPGFNHIALELNEWLYVDTNMDLHDISEEQFLAEFHPLIGDSHLTRTSWSANRHVKVWRKDDTEITVITRNLSEPDHLTREDLYILKAWVIAEEKRQGWIAPEYYKDIYERLKTTGLPL